MSEILKISKPTMKNIADALRDKTETEEAISARQMPGIINGLDIEKHEEDGIFVGNEFYEKGILDSLKEYHGKGYVDSYGNFIETAATSLPTKKNASNYTVVDYDSLRDFSDIENFPCLVEDNNTYCTINAMESNNRDNFFIRNAHGVLAPIDENRYSIMGHGVYDREDIDEDLFRLTKADFLCLSTDKVMDAINSYEEYDDGGIKFPLIAGEKTVVISSLKDDDYIEELYYVYDKTNDDAIILDKKGNCLEHGVLGYDIINEDNLDDSDRFYARESGCIGEDGNFLTYGMINKEGILYRAGLLDSTGEYKPAGVIGYNNDTDSLETHLVGIVDQSNYYYDSGILDENECYKSFGTFNRDGVYNKAGAIDPDGKFLNSSVLAGNYYNDDEVCSYEDDIHFYEKGILNKDGCYLPSGCLENNGESFESGIIDENGIYHEAGLLSPTGEYKYPGVFGMNYNENDESDTFAFVDYGILDGDGYFHGRGILESSGEHHENGVFSDGGYYSTGVVGNEYIDGTVSDETVAYNSGCVGKDGIMMKSGVVDFNGELYSCGVIAPDGNYLSLGVFGYNEETNSHEVHQNGIVDSEGNYHSNGMVTENGEYYSPSTPNGVRSICQELIDKFFNGNSTDFETYVHNVINDN